jgi:DNA sulfur modification protein DndE
MFTGIKTSKANKELVTQLTNRLGLGAENVIARVAFAYSLASEKQLDLLKIEDSQGKEYSSKVLFGDHVDIYIAMVCVHYQLYKTDKDIARYVKMHIDDGLQLIHNEVKRNNNINGTDFLISKIERGLKGLN